MQILLSIFSIKKKEAKKITFFDILSGVLTRVGSSWAHYKAFARAQKVLPWFCPESVLFEKKARYFVKNRPQIPVFYILA